MDYFFEFEREKAAIEERGYTTEELYKCKHYILLSK